jgi:hypothetical protein
VVFAAIDIAAWPRVQFHHGLGGKFNAGRGNSARSEKANSYYNGERVQAPEYLYEKNLVQAAE